MNCNYYHSNVLVVARLNLFPHLRSVVGHDVAADEQGGAVGHQAGEVDEGRAVRGVAR